MNQGLKHKTIKSYLLAIHHLQISEGLGDPFHGISMSKLEYMLKGVKKQQAEKGSGQSERLPTTNHLLRQIKQLWEKEGDSWDVKMLWAACCLCYMRAGEMTVPNNKDSDPAVHLSMGNIAVDDARSPAVVQINIKQTLFGEVSTCLWEELAPIRVQ